MRSLFRIRSKSVSAIVKRRLWASLVVATLFLAGGGSAATSAPPPRLKPAQEILSGVLPSSCGDLAPDEDGNLWCSDLLQRTIVKITPDGKRAETLESGHLFPGGLDGPGRLSISGSLLAVDDLNQTIHMVDVKAKRHIRTIPYDVLHGEARINPSAGFALWNERILFTGLGFESAPPPFDQPAQVMTLFSTGLDGRGLDIVRREALSASARPARALFGTGYCAPVRHGGMAVCQSLPGRLTLLGPGGKVLRETALPGFEVPAIPRGVLAREDLQAETMAATPHITGIFTAKDWIALVVQRPSAAGPRLAVSWYTLDLDLVKEESIDLPIQLSQWDVVARITYAPSGGVLFLIRHQVPGAAPSARLFRSALIW